MAAADNIALFSSLLFHRPEQICKVWKGVVTDLYEANWKVRVSLVKTMSNYTKTCNVHFHTDMLSKASCQEPLVHDLCRDRICVNLKKIQE